MTVYKPRSAWTSSRRGGAQLTGSKLVGIAWHWPGTAQDEIGVESEAATANRLRGYRNFHVGSRGWSDIGYNMAIDQAGRVWDLRGLGRVGAHCASPSNPDANHEWMGVLLILGDQERPSARMIRTCQDFFYDVFLPRWPRRTRDTGHGRAPGVPGAQTSCPGPFAAALIVDGDLTEEPDSGDDMPTAQEVAEATVNELARREFGTLVDGTQITGFRALLYGPRYSHLASVKLNDVRTNQAAQLKLLAEIKASQGAVDVDEARLAAELAPLLVAPLLAELDGVAGLTEQQAEDALERVLERVRLTTDS